MLRRIIVGSEFAKTNLSSTKLSGGTFISPEELSNPESQYYFPKLTDTALFIFGTETWQPIKELADLFFARHSEEEIKANKSLVADAPYT